MRQPRASSGVTAFELLVVLAVAAVLAGLAVPAFRELLLDARRTAEVNGLVAAVQLARSESIKRRRFVVLCQTSSGLDCEPPAGRWQGWLVFENTDRDDPPRLDPGESVLLERRLPAALAVASNRAAYVFRPPFRRSTNGTLTFCDARGPAEARAVIVSYTGRPRVDRPAPARVRIC